MAEAGYPQISGEAWFALVVPAGAPSDILTLLYRGIVKTLASSDVREKRDTLGFEVATLTPDASICLFRSEGAKWSKVIRDAGVKAQ